jgi:hypothetical protein
VPRDEGSGEAGRLAIVNLLGFSIGVSRDTKSLSSHSSVTSDIDIEVDIKATSSVAAVSCKVSELSVRLAYSDYAAIRRIFRDNIGRKVETTMWENVETAWAHESADTEHDQTIAHDVSYSSSARLIRYGQRQDTPGRASSVRLSLSLGSLSILLQRDDDSERCLPRYDMVLFRGQEFEFEAGQKDDGDRWIYLTVGNVFMFDLGKDGRHGNSGHESKNPLVILVEGYAAGETLCQGADCESHILIKLDKEKSGAIRAVMVVNYLSVTAFVAPLDDLVQFFSCNWPVLVPVEQLSVIDSNVNVPDLEAGLERPDTPRQRHYDLQLRFVAHYPRLIFAADESDPHSRALVIQG